eukprot:TRINITY_DN12841_c0_g1_i1.p1 TRINITY_DN12841_c0_g1~~TRINITY_DN12841_c0_g1_i1.p1  ORF type:complete len:102 (-),score=16.08 TRINITY_DN12841_c0_g1_i1:103-408(-)
MLITVKACVNNNKKNNTCFHSSSYYSIFYILNSLTNILLLLKKKKTQSLFPFPSSLLYPLSVLFLPPPFAPVAPPFPSPTTVGSKLFPTANSPSQGGTVVH